MKKPLLSIFAVAVLLSLPYAHAEESVPLKLSSKITLPDVKGRIDHMAVDLKGGRLFVAAAGNNTLEVIDLKEGKHICSVAGFKKPQGVAFAPDYNKIYVTNGQNGECDILNGDSFKLVNSIALPGNADNIRYEPAGRLVYVGFGKGAIGVIDPATDRLVERIGVDGHPESFQVESAGNKIFVNVPSLRSVVVIDKLKGGVIDKWLLPNLKGNVPMALDEDGHRAFIGCMAPPTLIIYNTKAGEYIFKTKMDKDADDIFYDPARKRVYVSCGSGFIDCFGSDETGRYTDTGKIKTSAGARTSLYVPEQSRFYLAVPRQGKQPAELWVYDVQ